MCKVYLAHTAPLRHPEAHAPARAKCSSGAEDLEEAEELTDGGHPTEGGHLTEREDLQDHEDLSEGGAPAANERHVPSERDAAAAEEPRSDSERDDSGSAPTEGELLSYSEEEASAAAAAEAAAGAAAGALRVGTRASELGYPGNGGDSDGERLPWEEEDAAAPLPWEEADKAEHQQHGAGEDGRRERLAGTGVSISQQEIELALAPMAQEELYSGDDFEEEEEEDGASPSSFVRASRKAVRSRGVLAGSKHEGRG